jgi:orotidine-5'-phosphate decarboxylase
MAAGAQPFLYVAIDHIDKNTVYRAAEELAGVDSDRFGYKVNLDFILLNGVDSVKPLVDIGKKVFADLKMWNGGRTMSTIAKRLDELGVKATNAYSHAGVKFLRKLNDSLSENCDLFGITVLTHYTDADCQRIYGCGLKEAVRRLALIPQEAGCDGIILPGTALDVVGDMSMHKMVPAVRPKWYADRKDNFQEQTSTPREAIEGGADILVCGSPILKSENRVDALHRVLDEMNI